MKVIAVDDEPIALDIISNHAEKVPFVDLIAVFLSATEAITYVRSETVDLVLLDISMPDLSGLEFATMLKSQVQVIFTTAYPEHALKGFELAATDYLLKPINFNRFFKACELAQSRMQLPDNRKLGQEENLFVKDGHNWVQIKFDNLLYAKGEDNYVGLFENTKQTLTRMTLTDLYNKLPKDKFIRIHKSYIISISKIERIEKHQIVIGDIKIPLSKLYRDSLLQLVNKNTQ